MCRQFCYHVFLCDVRSGRKRFKRQRPPPPAGCQPAGAAFTKSSAGFWDSVKAIIESKVSGWHSLVESLEFPKRPYLILPCWAQLPFRGFVGSETKKVTSWSTILCGNLVKWVCVATQVKTQSSMYCEGFYCQAQERSVKMSVWASITGR